jgi:hypothetical protein
MRRLLPVFALLLLAACGQNPLLKTAAADFAPFRVGSQWTYTAPSGAAGFSRQVTAAGPYQGRSAFTLVDTGTISGTSYWSFEQGALEDYSAGGWTLRRRLPYVSGNKWALPGALPNISRTQFVEGIESVTVPAGKFDACYKLRTKISTYDSATDLTTTVDEAIAWAAPNVGDVRYATVDALGAVTVVLELSSYNIPR